ncbi:MAG: hypothetical protein KatS3mg088_715 [Patescibacteria group bacterium]|nr:MAG: hypothetical protein KatS3mg088_715 [Patescibacteria group bacterium]
MPKLSSKKIDRQLEKEILNQFWVSIAKINTVDGASQFFSDILTETEKKMISKRLAAAILLAREKSATDIKNSLNLTYSTIGTIAAWVKNAKKETRRILLQFSKEKNWEAIVDKIEEILDKLPPRYGTNWSLVEKERYQRKIKRARKSLLR